MFENIAKVYHDLQELGITGVQAGAHIHVLNTYIDLLQRACEHLGFIATAEHETYSHLQKVLGALGDITRADHLSAGTDGTGEVSQSETSAASVSITSHAPVSLIQFDPIHKLKTLIHSHHPHV